MFDINGKLLQSPRQPINDELTPATLGALLVSKESHLNSALYESKCIGNHFPGKVLDVTGMM